METPPGDRDKLVRLEERVAALEWSLQRLIAAGAAPRAPLSPSPRPLAAPQLSPAPPAGKPLPNPFKPVARPDDVDLEQWFGSRGLLLVGVVALLTAGGFFFKYAFDRGWVAPWLRVLGGLVTGAALAAVGEWQVARSLRRYGLAMIGAGGGLMFLALWAAAGPYAMIGRQAGTLVIAAITAALAWRAAHHDAEPLALWALLGAFAAPILLPAPEARPETLLAYTALISYAAGALAHHHRWRAAFDLTLVGYFVVTPSLVPDVMPTVPGLAFAALGGMMALRAVRDQAWPEARLGAQALAWLLLLMNAGRAEGAAEWAVVASAAALLLATWWDGRGDERFHSSEPKLDADADDAILLLAPAACCAVTAIAAPGPLREAPEIATAAVAALYLLTGWRGRWATFVAMGFALLAVAIGQQWRGAMLVVEWSTLALLAVVAESRLDQRGGPPVALLIASVAFVTLLTGLVSAPDSAAFTGAWALALYANVLALGLAAWSWRSRADEPSWHQTGPAVFWALAGVALLAGVSIELQRFFAARAEAGGARIAGDLAISVWWLVYAGAAVRLGFWLNHPVVRSAGLVVAALAALKVALYDLSRLDSLYRVASFLGLSLIALAVAYAYNRRVTRSV